MEKHIVEQGECLASIAHQFGFRNWKTIYGASENAAFRKKRPNPNVICAGDALVIPDKQEKTEACPTERRHKFKAKVSRWMFRIEMKDEEGVGIEDAPYELLIPGLPPIKGETQTDGLIEVEVLQDAREATLKFMGEEFRVHLGMLDPVSLVTGVQARLNNLGFNAGAVDGVVGPQTRRAVYAFQSSQPGLKPTGIIDDETRKRLLKLHDNDDRYAGAEEDMSPTKGTEIVLESPAEGSEPPADVDEGVGQVSDWNIQRRGYEM